MKNFILLFAILTFLISCDNKKGQAIEAESTTLLVSTNGRFINFNLDENKINWEYNSALDSSGNRNYFAIDGQNIFMPFESGKLINFDLNTGKIIWKQQIYGNEDQILAMSSDENAQAEMLQTLMPLFMSKPLIDGENIIIASSGQPSQTGAYLYKFNRTTGEKKWHSDLPTIYNFFAPIKFRDFYFVNSAVFLEKFSMEGTATSYGMFEGDVQVAGEPLQNNEKNQFPDPIYNQMQSDSKNIYIGDDEGKLFCLSLDENADMPNGDISDPNNTFVKNKKAFKWIFSDENFNFPRNWITFLENDVLYAEMKNGSASQSCIYAIDSENGKPKWKKIINGDVLNWNLQNDMIIGNTENTIFYLNINGDDFIEIKTESKPLSNIELMDKNHLIYLTQNGIEILDTETKKAKNIYKKSYNKTGDHNNVQIKFISK